MLDEALEKLGVPLEHRHQKPRISVEVTSEPADENTTETITEYGYGCGQVVTEKKVTKVRKPPVVAILYATAGTTSAAHSRTAGTAVSTPRCPHHHTDKPQPYLHGKDGARSDAILKYLGGGCAAGQFAVMGKDECRKSGRTRWYMATGGWWK